MKMPFAVALASIACTGFASLAAADSCRIEERVAKIVAEEYGKKQGQVSVQDKFAADGPNTIEDVEIKLGVEAEFKLKIADAAAWAKLVTVADIDAYLRARLKSCT
jgi:acyl carrier protein